ncbi:MAG: mitochondrial K+-H+ exchange-related family protein [Acidobacteriota bacterium]|nr:mitochondrial K+-H+ exchange-related family protein [Acidobacteriota bacterium]
MDVYLVPVGRGRHELYCEVSDDAAQGMADEADGTTFIGRMKKRAADAIADAEKEWRDRQAGRIEMPSGRWGRIKARMRAWVAERVAEQRLLWHLRRQETCALFHADDVTGDASLVLMRDSLQRDYERHRRWFAWNVIGFIASGLTFLVPGPNLLAYYFFFRLAGHYLSMKGARHGLDLVAWSPSPSQELTELRALADRPLPERSARVRAIGESLGLEHLATFFNRLAAV